MDCEQFDQIVMDVLYGELTDEQLSAAARRHVDRCSRCASELGALRAARKLSALPLMEPPAHIFDSCVEAARLAQRQLSWPRRIGRWISLAGSYAMRPQFTMGALLLLLIGSSLVLLRGRPGSAQVGVVRVTEQGVPERERAELPALDSPELLAGHAVPSARLSSDLLPQPAPGADSAEPSRPRDDGTRPDSSAAAASSSSVSDDPFSQAMAMYKAREFANAYRAFDQVAAAGGPRAEEAALFAARAIRASSGCPNAAPRLDAIIAQHASAAVATEARFEAAACARLMGNFDRARLLLEPLTNNPSLRARAEKELARLTPAASASSTQPPPEPPPDDSP